MKKRWIVALGLALVMLLMMTQAAGAVTLNPAKTTVTTTMDGKTVKSITAKFFWPDDQGLASATSYLVVLDGDIGNGNDLFFYYERKGYRSLQAAIDGVCTEQKLKCLWSSGVGQPVEPGRYTTLTLDGGKITNDSSYYIYVFTQWGGSFYPDARLGELSVQNGTTKFLAGNTKVSSGSNSGSNSGTNSSSTPETKPETKPSAEVKKAAESMPKTGDESLPLLYLALGMSCCAAMLILKRKNA